MFQPYHELTSGNAAGYEALVRWRHPRDGLLTPASFLPLAEDIGLIEAVDRWVLDEACRQARSVAVAARGFRQCLSGTAPERRPGPARHRHPRPDRSGPKPVEFRTQ